MDVPGYTDLVPLGRGGFSTVYRARQVAVERDVALKVLAVDLVDEAARGRFRRECATNGRVGAHPAVVTVYDSGFTSDGHPFLSMQLCPGGSLADRLRAAGPLPVPEVLHAGVSIAAALAFAHSVGVLHRDIKPENILLGQFGEPLLADFGIATVDDQRVSTMTAASFTINHAAPECLAGAPPSVAADVYGLSSTLYTLLAGHPPFVAGTAAALVSLVAMVMNEPAPPLTRSDVPPALNQLLLSGLAKAPTARPPDATAFGRGLQAVQAQLGLPVTPWPATPAMTGATGPVTAAGVITGGGPATGATGAGSVTGGGTGRAATLGGAAVVAGAAALTGSTPFGGSTASAGGSPSGTVQGSTVHAVTSGGPPPSGPSTGQNPGTGIAPVVMPEQIAPIDPADLTRMGVPPTAAASMTMVAPGVRTPGGGPGGPGGPSGRGPGAAGAATGPGRNRRTGLAVALTAAAVVLAIAAGTLIYFLAGNDSNSAAGPAAPTGDTAVSGTAGTSTGDTASSSETASSEESSVTESPSATESSEDTATEFGGTEATIAPPGDTPLTVPDAPQQQPPPRVTKTVVVTTTKSPERPHIDTFGTSGLTNNMVDCSNQDTVTLRFVWSASHASTAWIAVDGGPDASQAPFESDLPAVVGPSNSQVPFVEVPFACSEQQHDYTLTVRGPAGKVSTTITLQRAPLPTASATDNPTATDDPGATTTTDTPTTTATP